MYVCENYVVFHLQDKSHVFKYQVIYESGLDHKSKAIEYMLYYVIYRIYVELFSQVYISAIMFLKLTIDCLDLINQKSLDLALKG